jgi:hypothetical protein
MSVEEEEHFCQNFFGLDLKPFGSSCSVFSFGLFLISSQIFALLFLALSTKVFPRF